MATEILFIRPDLTSKGHLADYIYPGNKGFKQFIQMGMAIKYIVTLLGNINVAQ